MLISYQTERTMKRENDMYVWRNCFYITTTTAYGSGLVIYLILPIENLQPLTEIVAYVYVSHRHYTSTSSTSRSSVAFFCVYFPPSLYCVVYSSLVSIMRLEVHTRRQSCTRYKEMCCYIHKQAIADAPLYTSRLSLTHSSPPWTCTSTCSTTCTPRHPSIFDYGPTPV